MVAIRRTALTLTVVSFILFCGCGGDEPGAGDPGSKELFLYCAAGIRPPIEEVVNEFMRQSGVKIVTDYAGSEVLLSKIKLVQRGDLYMPGDRHYVDQAAAEGFVDSRQQVFYWVPTILVQKGNPKNISSLKDLLRSDVKAGLGDPKSCAIGRSTRQIFEKNDIAWDQVEKNLSFQSQTVNELGMQIQAGSLDAVVVWDAMAKYYAEHGDMVEIPVEQNIVSSVDVAVLSFSENRQLAEEFLAFLTSERGQGVFEANNYQTKAPK